MDLPMAPKGGLTGHVERALKQALMEGSLKPGERLVARDLAERLGTSQTPVREALLKLVASGALEAMPAQSFQVAAPSVARYREITDIRRVVEALAVERACARISNDDIAKLQVINRRYKDARARNAVHEALHENKEFRLMLYARADMPTLHAVIESLWLKIGPSLNFLFPVDRERLADPHNHDLLLDALARRDAKRAVKLIQKAIDEGAEIVLKRLGEIEQPQASPQKLRSTLDG
ncbi:MAG: GntR family transcriptional regulator [Hyphomicrobiales bacterium]